MNHPNARFAPLNLFSSFVSNYEKENIANAISNVNPPAVYLRGKPKFRKLPKSRNLATRTQLVDFVDAETHFIFDNLNFGQSFLNLPYTDWHLN